MEGTARYRATFTCNSDTSEGERNCEQCEEMTARQEENDKGGRNYLAMLQENIITAVYLLRPYDDCSFQQVVAPPHYDRDVRSLLEETFVGRWLGRRGSAECVSRSLENTVYAPKSWALEATGVVAGMKGREKRDIPEKTHRPAASSGTIPTCENPGVTRPEIEPSSHSWEAGDIPLIFQKNVHSIVYSNPAVWREIELAEEENKIRCRAAVFPGCLCHFGSQSVSKRARTRQSGRKLHAAEVARLLTARRRRSRAGLDPLPTVAERIDCSPPTNTNRVRSPAGSLRILASWNRAGRCRWFAGFLKDLQFPQPLHSSAAPFSPHFTLIGYQDIVVKISPDLSIRPLFTERVLILSHLGTTERSFRNIRSRLLREVGKKERYQPCHLVRNPPPASLWSDLGKQWKTEIRMAKPGFEPKASRMRVQWSTTMTPCSVFQRNDRLTGPFLNRHFSKDFEPKSSMYSAYARQFYTVTCRLPCVQETVVLFYCGNGDYDTL
ncbi:hypothetical protein PR048_022554 [Dryococelus australis]|uniref:Uncharacterized protein n=1 Tax=Dryococelus australis TaxID=614101 RepID=A0ABQ9H1C8_9NEOP|nr:hypothetical protein PR048_022554 [Dryococelus australis]